MQIEDRQHAAIIGASVSQLSPSTSNIASKRFACNQPTIPSPGSVSVSWIGQWVAAPFEFDQDGHFSGVAVVDFVPGVAAAED